MSRDASQSYLSGLGTRLEGQGYKPLENPEADGAWRQRKGSFLKFGVVDTFVVAKYLPRDTLDRDLFRGFCSGAFDFGLKNKVWLPRGFGGTAVVHPVVVTDELDRDLCLFVEDEYCPKHWASFEFPVVHDLSSGRIHFYTKTPAWGAAYYRGMRKAVQALFEV